MSSFTGLKPTKQPDNYITQQSRRDPVTVSQSTPLKDEHALLEYEADPSWAVQKLSCLKHPV